MVYLRHPSNDPPGHGKGKTYASEDKNHVPRGLEYIPSGPVRHSMYWLGSRAVTGTTYFRSNVLGG